MANRRFVQFYNTLHKEVVQLDCNFTVDSANGNGLGIRSLKGAGIENVFMNTSATAGVGNGGVTNPNPAAGNILVQFEDNYNYYIGGSAGFVSPVSGTPIVVTAAGAHLVVGTVYVIGSVGTSTAADWVALGVPIGTKAAVGVAFVAAATGAGVGSGAVEVPKATHSGIDHIEVVGDPNQTVISQLGAVLGAATGPYLMAAALSGGTLTAPADDTVIGMIFVFSNSSIQNQGY